MKTEPPAVFGKLTPPDMQKAFDERFLLITPENVEEIDRKSPEIFEKEGGEAK